MRAKSKFHKLYTIIFQHSRPKSYIIKMHCGSSTSRERRAYVICHCLHYLFPPPIFKECTSTAAELLGKKLRTVRPLPLIDVQSWDLQTSSFGNRYTLLSVAKKRNLPSLIMNGWAALCKTPPGDASTLEPKRGEFETCRASFAHGPASLLPSKAGLVKLARLHCNGLNAKSERCLYYVATLYSAAVSSASFCLASLVELR